MGPGIRYLLEPRSERWRITHCVLRLIDAQRAELRVCAASPFAFPGASEAFEAVSRLGAWLAARNDDAIDFDDDEAARTWTTVIPVEALPSDMRAVLNVAADLYESDELDLGVSDELEALLLSLRGTTWTPEPVVATLH